MTGRLSGRTPCERRLDVLFITMSSNVNSDRAYEYIRKRILSGEYRRGQHLMAKTVSTELEISPTPVRDAFRQLETDGLVTIRPRLGAQVNAMGLKEFRDLCELRLVLETHTAGLAAQRRTEHELHELELALNEMRRLTREILAATGPEASRLLAEMARADAQFHVAIMTAAKNDLIRGEILRLHLINRVIARGSHVVSNDSDAAHLRQVLADHEAIFEAILRRNAAGARVAMERSLQDIIDQTIHVMARQERELIAREFTEETLRDTA
jgi:DNA-binding GntR family transcriptional regulator